MNDFFDENDEFRFWQLHDQLTLPQAACLVLSLDPAALGFDGLGGSIERKSHATLRYLLVHDTEFDPLLKDYTVLLAALLGSVTTGNLVASNSFDIGGDPDPRYLNVRVDDLRNWLEQKKIYPPFFFTDNSTRRTDYRNSKHPRFAPKLEAAIRAWEAVTEVSGQSVKQALEKWLNTNAKEFGFVDKDGAPIKQTIEDIAKVANWQTSGGAPKTPT